MTRRLSTAAACLAILALSALCLAPALLAQPPAGDGSAPSVLSTPAGLAALLKRIAPVADTCNGGSCLTGLNGVLTCPTSGGPTCGSSQPCGCVCAQMPNGSWSSVNYCFSQ